MKYKTILFFSCLYALFVWLLHFPASREFDLQAMRAIHGIDLPFLAYAFVPFVIVGSAQIAILFFLLFSFWFYWKGDFQKAYLCLASLLIATGFELLLKKILLILPPSADFLGRFPVKWNSISIKTQSSFPSGHMMRATLFCALFICWFGYSRNSAFSAAFVAIPVVTGFAMVYYGFHWIGDIIGGAWLALLVCFISCRLSDIKPSRSHDQVR